MKRENGNSSEVLMKVPTKEVRRLIEVYGPSPSNVGAIDGTEDDYGDLLIEVADLLGVDWEADDPAWQAFQEAALDADAMPMRQWVDHLQTVMAERG